LILRVNRTDFRAAATLHTGVERNEFLNGKRKRRFSGSRLKGLAGHQIDEHDDRDRYDMPKFLIIRDKSNERGQEQPGDRPQRIVDRGPGETQRSDEFAQAEGDKPILGH
jgi:hypothetical protein